MYEDNSVMTIFRSKSACLIVFCAAAGACVHTPPGTSVELALAQRPEVISVPPPPQAIVAAHPNKSRESAMPVQDKTDRVADAFSRGEFCMKAGKDEEAIVAFREAVQ